MYGRLEITWNFVPHEIQNLLFPLGVLIGFRFYQRSHETRTRFFDSASRAQLIYNRLPTLNRSNSSNMIMRRQKLVVGYVQMTF